MNDLKVGLRVLRKNPGPSLFAVLALTLGIGLSVMMFSIIYGAIHRGLPFERSEQLVHLERAQPSRGIESMEVTIHDFTDWRAQQRQSFVDLGAWYAGTVNVADRGVPERYDGAFITPSTFALLGVRPVDGRLFREEETSRAEPLSVLIGYRMWQDRYEGDPEIVGRVIRVNGEPATVAGVMPEDFLFPLATSVAQRTREVGVRMALGAQARDVLTMVLRQGMVQIAIGIALGLGIAAALGNLLAIVLYEVDPRDPVVFASIITFLVAAALFACFVPARRATRVDPNIALRAE